jgi:putative hydrolase of the HAD superfamily
VIVYKPIAKVKAISFDLDDTFYANWPYIVEADKYLRSYIKAKYPLAARLESKDWLRIKKQALSEDPELCHDMGELRAVTLTKAFEICGMKASDIPAAVQDCFDTFYHKRSDFDVAPHVHQVLQTLSASLPIVAITNGNVNCEQIGIAKYFTHILHASKKQRMKPYPDMFALAASLLKLPAKHILHVGDNLEKDVWGATRAGYSSAWYAYDRKMDLRKESVATLPHIQLGDLSEIESFVG